MDRVQHYSLETGRQLNIFAAAGICVADGTLLAMCRALHAAASALAEDGCARFIEELALLPPGSALSQAAISSANFDEGAVESLCYAYLAKLHERKLGLENSFDPVLIADLLMGRLLGDEPWRGAPTLYALSWKVVRRYKLNGWHILVPLIIAFDLGLPGLAGLRALTKSLDCLSAGPSSMTVAQLLKLSGLSNFRDGSRLLETFVDNRWDVAFNTENWTEVHSTRGASLCFELLARHGREHQWFRLSGIAMASNETPSVQYDRAKITNFLAHHRVEAVNRLCCEQMLLKALLVRKVPECFEQGLSACIYNSLVRLLVERQEVTSIAQARQHCGLQSLSINPFSILPGRLLVYAPSPRFLEPAAVSFVLREWVQDMDHRKGRIAPDRVLTPLEPVKWTISATTLKTMIRASRSFELFGVAFWPELLRPMLASVSQQARRWAAYHLDLQSINVLRENGLYRIGNIILDQASWGDLSRGSRAFPIIASTIANAHDVALQERDAAIALLVQYAS